MLDLNLLEETRKPVIHCREKWQAEMLINEFNALLPGGVNLNAMTWWSFYEDETCYFVDINMRGGKLGNVRFEYCKESWYKNHGYTVLEFYDVVGELRLKDFGEIAPSHLPVTKLFEIGV